MLIAIFMGVLIVYFNFVEEGRYEAAIWDSIATVINAEMPSFDDGAYVSAVMDAVLKSVESGKQECVKL